MSARKWARGEYAMYTNPTVVPPREVKVYVCGRLEGDSCPVVHKARDNDPNYHTFAVRDKDLAPTHTLGMEGEPFRKRLLSVGTPIDVACAFVHERDELTKAEEHAQHLIEALHVAIEDRERAQEKEHALQVVADGRAAQIATMWAREKARIIRSGKVERAAMAMLYHLDKLTLSAQGNADFSMSMTVKSGDWGHIRDLVVSTRAMLEPNGPAVRLDAAVKAPVAGDPRTHAERMRDAESDMCGDDEL